MLDDLMLLSGNDIPFIEAGVFIHQPRLKEIAVIGEETFFTGGELLNFSKNMLSEEDKIHLEKHTNFDILIAILREQNAVMRKNRDCVKLVLTLLFPDYIINFNINNISLKKEDEQQEHFINNENYEIFKKLINKIFAQSKEESTSFNPAGSMSAKIAEKLQQRHRKLAENKGPQKVDIISRYISILTVGEHKDMNSFLNYTYYQICDEFKRFELKSAYDLYVKAKMAGAKDLKEIDDWMGDIHSNNKNK